MKHKLTLSQRTFLVLNTIKHNIVGNSVCILGIISMATYLLQGLLENDVALKIFGITAFILFIDMILNIVIDIIMLLIACYIELRNKA